MSRLIQDGRISQRLYNRFTVRDRIPLEIEPSVQPVCIVEDLREPSDESAYIMRAGCTVLTALPLAGLVGQVALFNPTGSSVFLRLVASWGAIPNGPNDRADGGFVAAGLATPSIAERFLNSFGARTFSANEMKPSGQVSSAVTSAATGTLTTAMLVGILPGGYPPLPTAGDPGILLDEGVGWMWSCNVVAQQFLCMLAWDEIPKAKYGRQ